MLSLNKQPISRFSFPNNETGINLPKDTHGYNNITMFYESDQDLFDLILLTRHIHENEPEANIELTISYMPYSRMDRANSDYIFSLKYVCDLINWLDFDKVYVVEPHSDVTCALLNRSKPIWVVEILLEEVFEAIKFDTACDYLVFPDAGAQKRYEKIGDYNALVGVKERDFATGNIEGYHMVTVEGAGLFRGRKALIIDDLCSGGRTFIEAAKELNDLKFDEVHLLVAHVEPNIYNGLIFDWIKSVHGTTSLQSKSENDQLHLYDLKDIIDKWY